MKIGFRHTTFQKGKKHGRTNEGVRVSRVISALLSKTVLCGGGCSRISG